MKVVNSSNNKPLITSVESPEIGNLATPVNASPWSIKFINNLPAYRPGLSANRRGLEVGMAHGYFLFGPFAWYNALRDTSTGDFVGLVETIILVVILTFALSIYATVLDINGPIPNVTVAQPPKEFYSQQGWRDFATGFLVGGLGGGITAYFVYQVVKLIIF